MAEYKSTELENEVKKGFQPSPTEVEVVKRVHQRFLDMQSERDKSRREFDGRTLTQYVMDSRDAYNGIVSDEVKASKEDWQSLIWDHKTRGKLNTVVAMIIGARPFISIVGKNYKSNKFAQDLFNIYEDTWKQEKGSYKLFQQAMSICIDGTGIVEEMYTEEKYKQKDIVEIDQQTGKIKFKEKEVIRGGVGRVEADLVDLLEFYPNETSEEIKHDCVKLKKYTRKAFNNKYGKYPDAEYVLKGTIYFDFYDGSYKETKMVQGDDIEVLQYYNEDFDEYVILANDIWINKQNKDEIAPIPFDHHRLPFAKGIFEFSGVKSFYGKSFPDIANGEQSVTNAIERLIVDREILALNRGFVLGAGVEIDSYDLYPGSIKHLTGQPGQPLQNQIMEMPMSGADQSSFLLLQLMRSQSDTNTAIDPVAQGVSSGGRKTARETVILDENAKRSSGPFSVQIYKLLWDRAELRIENIKQFYTSPLQTAVLEDNQGSPIVNSDGSTNPTVDKYREITVQRPGKEPRWFEVNPEIKGCEFNVRFVEDYETSQSQSTRIEMSRALLDEAKANPLVNADEATIEWLESLRKNPDRFYLKPKPADVQFQNSQGVPPENSPAVKQQMMGVSQ